MHCACDIDRTIEQDGRIRADFAAAAAHVARADHVVWKGEYGAALLATITIACFSAPVVRLAVIGLDEWQYRVAR